MRRLALIVALVVVVLIGVAQLALPGLAVRRLRDRLARHGTVERVEVHAVPAIELLWGHADRVVVRMSSYAPGPTSRLADLFAHASATDRLDAETGQLSTGLLTLRDATVRKSGAQLDGRARLTDADLRAALPPVLDVRPVASGDGQLVLQGTATLLGASVSIRARLLALAGRLVLEPEGLPLGALASITVFSDPRVAIEGVGASRTSNGYVLTARARLHG